MKRVITTITLLAVIVSAFTVSSFAVDTPADYATQSVEVHVAATRAATYYKTNCVCNLRANAGTSYASYCTLPKGQVVVLHSSKTSGGYTWYYVSVVGGTYAGYYGYIRSDLLNYYYWG